jgi:hypothetical protein
MNPISEIKEKQREEQLEDIYENGDVVFSNIWNSDELGVGSDSETVHKLGKLYVVASSFDGLSGPFSSLEAALKSDDGPVMVGATTTSISCQALSGEAVVRLLFSTEDEPFEIEVNGDQWRFEKVSGFCRV